MADKEFVVRQGLVVNNALVANSSAIVIKLAGSGGSAGQVLSSNGSGGLSWYDVPSSNGSFTFSNTVSFTGNTTFSGNASFNGLASFNANATFNGTMFINGVSANGTLGTAGQVLTTDGTDTYWSTIVSSNGSGNVIVTGTSINLSTNNTSLSTYYFPMSNTSSGTWSNGVIANTGLYFVPATGTLSATIFNSLSDLEYKTDVEPINNAVDVLKQIDGVSFRWKDTGHKSYGVIAQEIEKVLPDIVDINNDVKSVNYQALIGFLIEAVKELSDKVEKLENNE